MFYYLLMVIHGWPCSSNQYNQERGSHIPIPLVLIYPICNRVDTVSHKIYEGENTRKLPWRENIWMHFAPWNYHGESTFVMYKMWCHHGLIRRKIQEIYELYLDKKSILSFDVVSLLKFCSHKWQKVHGRKVFWFSTKHSPTTRMGENMGISQVKWAQKVYLG